MAAVESDCFFLRNFLSGLPSLGKAIAVVLALLFSSWVVLCLRPFLLRDFDLDYLSFKTLASLRGCDLSLRAGWCRLLMEGLLGFWESFFLVSLRSSRALPHELLYFLLSYASLRRVVSSIIICWRLPFLLTELRLSKDSRSCFLLVESKERRFRLTSGG